MYNKRAIELNIAAGTNKHALNFSRAKLKKKPTTIPAEVPHRAKRWMLDMKYCSIPLPSNATLENRTSRAQLQVTESELREQRSLMNLAD